MEDFIAERSAFIASAEPGVDATRRLCEMTDEAVRVLARAASSRLTDRWAIVALGGWGAGGLQPNSDLDILVVSEAPVDRLKPFVEAVLYPLWDGGLKVGHQVRSPKQQVRAMREDLKTCSAALTARPLAGDVDWADSAIASWVKDARKRQRGLLREFAGRPRPGSPYQLEPDLKEGAGGRRDYDELVWSSAVITGGVGGNLHGLVDADVLTAEELGDLEEAARVVATARWELQRGGHGDRMTLDGVADLSSVDPERVQESLGLTALVLQRVRRRLTGARSTAGESAQLSSSEVFALLESRDNVEVAFEEAAQAGRLDELLPGFRSLMSCRRPGIGHELTVGAHSIRTAALLASPPETDRALSRSLAEAGDMRIAWVAALAHDAAKCTDGAGHAERGAAPAAAAAARFGLSDEQARDVSDLVRTHLTLAETALRDDLDDEDAVLRCAAVVGRRELLAPLHLLTAADSRSTGPATWTPWTAALVATLVARLDAALSPDVDGAGLASRGQAVRDATLSSMPQATEAELTFVRNASLRYLATREPSQVARHARLVAELAAAPTATEALIEVSAGPAESTHAVTVAAPDRPELLARLAGAMALAGLDILSLDAYGGDGIALDSFVVASATRRAVTTETFVQLERLAKAALRDRLELATRLAERRKHYPSRTKGPAEVSVRPAGWATELSVVAPDRPGLLHDIARAVSASGVDIRWAKIQTIEGLARDVFHLTGHDGGPVDDPGVLGHVTMRVRDAL